MLHHLNLESKCFRLFSLALCIEEQEEEPQALNPCQAMLEPAAYGNSTADILGFGVRSLEFGV